MEIYVVKEGDTVTAIAEQFQVPVSRVIYDNQLNAAGSLTTGQALLILIPQVIHIIQNGESIEDIAAHYGVSVMAILRNNPYLLQEKYLIAGDAIVIHYRREPENLIPAWGYAYTFIDRNILRETLLYLDQLLIFSYGFTEEGELIPLNDDQELIAEAWSFGVDPYLVLTPFTETGTFNNELILTVSKEREVQRKLILNILNTVQQKGYAGVNVDFEYNLVENREGYAMFLRNLRAVLNESGYQLTVAVVPKTSREQKGLLYEGIDYKRIGGNVDGVFLMTYEWGYTYGPAMAVAPFNSVQDVLEYAITEIAPDKIFLGIPNYAYDWSFPYHAGTSRAVSMGNVDAVNLAIEKRADIQFDEIAQTPYFKYTQDGVIHEVWFEDPRSIKAKLELALEFRCGGVGYWTLMHPFRANWLLLNNFPARLTRK